MIGMRLPFVVGWAILLGTISPRLSRHSADGLSLAKTIGARLAPLMD